MFITSFLVTNPADDYLVDVCAVDEVTVESPRTFSVNDLRVSVFRSGDHFYAIDDACPHAGASLALGYRTNDMIACRFHHWQFSLLTGQCTNESRTNCHVKTYPVHVCNGRIAVVIRSINSPRE